MKLSNMVMFIGPTAIELAEINTNNAENSNNNAEIGIRLSMVSSFQVRIKSYLRVELLQVF
ncbi:hypothetical protein GCM10007932_11090 [Vibrio penaeicida]|uniref:Uncharacterized protein n=1 Tax=Vibrio penaeicida TaxID=104609 RepID=A0AAV5NN11_9VIBR|nr:hypothetical protein GCM10007932_11090 [Vibrio penaeicida]